MSDDNNERLMVKYHTNDYLTGLPEWRNEGLDTVLEEIFKIKQENPRTQINLIGFDGKEEYDVADVTACSNIPYMYIGLPDGNLSDKFIPLDPDEMLEWMNDKRKFISDLKEEIYSVWKLDGDCLWRVFEYSEKEVWEIILFVNRADSGKAKEIMDDFNHEISAFGYPALYFDSECAVITGELQPKKIKGLFNRKKIKRENEWYDKRFDTLLDALKPHLRRFQEPERI